jgi:hypothetical protein
MEQAIEFLEKSLQAKMLTGNIRGIAHTYLSLACAHMFKEAVS